MAPLAPTSAFWQSPNWSGHAPTPRRIVSFGKKSTTKSERIYIRFEQYEKATLQEAADADGLTVGAYVQKPLGQYTWIHYFDFPRTDSSFF